MHWCAHEASARWIGGCLLVLGRLGRSLGWNTGIKGIEFLLSTISFVLTPADREREREGEEREGEERIRFGRRTHSYKKTEEVQRGVNENAERKANA